MSKDKPVSMRLTENESEIVKKRAAEKGLSLSRYIVQAAVADEGLTANKKQQIYRFKSMIQNYAKQILNEGGNENARKIYDVVNELWQLLK